MKVNFVIIKIISFAACRTAGEKELKGFVLVYCFCLPN